MAPHRTTRRALLGGALALPALHGARGATAEADVAIIGAGAAGLAAAKELARAGRSFVVLEARARIGGRVHTDRSLGTPFDAGAQYIHWAERNPWRDYARQYGVQVADERWGGPPRVFHSGRPLTDEERERRRGSFSRVWSALTLENGRDRSFGAAVQGRPEEIVAAAQAITRLSLGEEPERVSLADYEQLWSGDDDLLPDGYGTLFERYAADVPARREHPVSGIRWGGPLVAVEGPWGALRARTALVTVPVGVLQAGAIRFAPELPAGTGEAIDGLRMGAYTKIALRIDRERLGTLADTDLYEVGPGRAMTSFEFWPFGRDLAVAYLGGDHARVLCEAGEGAAVDFATERLAALVGPRLRQAVTGGRLAGWWSDPFARGSYSIVRPGRLPARQALRAPVAQKLWFAGEATAGGGAMTVGGATLEGQRAAREIIRLHRA